MGVILREPDGWNGAPVETLSDTYCISQNLWRRISAWVRDWG